MATGKQVAARLDAASKQRITEAIRGQMKRASLDAEAKAKLNITDRLTMRSGALRASIRADLSNDSHVLTLRAGGPTVPYAAIQELGGTVYPKRGKYLAIPLQERLRGIWPRDLNELDTFVLTRGGRPFIVQRTDTGLVFLYRLVESVTLRPVRYLRDAIEAAAAELGKRLRKEIGAILRGQVSSAG
jgi:phage gpG-like protein